MHRSLKSLFFLLLWLGSAVSVSVFGQDTSPVTPLPSTPSPNTPISPSEITTKQAQDFYKRAKASGMTDTDIENAAQQRGYSRDQISNMRGRLGGQNAQGAGQNDNRDELDDTRDEINLDEEANNEQDSTRLSRISGRLINRTFGASFFSRGAPSFEPNLRIATPKNYIIGPEDEIVIDIYGHAVNNFRTRVSPEGTIKMLNLAPIYVNGLTFEEAKQRIVSRLRQPYAGLDVPGSGIHASITLGNVRSIQVMITGEVFRPGTYTVSSLSTAFNALYKSGGPSQNGSYRNIEIIRNNNVIRKIDLYRFLVDADLQDNIGLQDQDIILIRPYETRVELVGQVKKTGIFEIKKGETYQDLLRYAGGYRPEAFRDLIDYQRNTGSSYVIGSISDEESKTFEPQNGDIFTVKRILDVVSNQIEIYGAVTRPGRYALEERSNTVLKLIELAQGVSDRAFLSRVVIERSSGSTQTGVLSFDLRKIINGEEEDIPLLPGDILTIKSVEDLKEFTYLTIQGYVANPGGYYYYKDITIADLIFMAGGYKEGGIPYRIEVARRVKEDTVGIPENQNVQIFTMEVADNLQMSELDKHFKLAPHDLVIVRKHPRYEVQRKVAVLGEVMYPGTYTIISNFERISDLFQKAGGLKPEAYLQAAKFRRQNEDVAVDLSAILEKPSIPANLLLLDGDTLIISRKSEIVRIQGGVQNPSLTNFNPSFSYKDYISQAGGYAERAWKNRVYVKHPNGRTQRTTHFLWFKSYPKVVPGAVVIVPQKAPKVERQTTPAERIAMFSLVASMLSTSALLYLRTR